VMHEGRIMGEIPGSEATEEMILMMATGQIMGNEEDRVP
jgi:ABC-type sugar transport system ATPase subunit